MIIECKKCGTKYRFDESLIVAEGVWVRCSHCKDVFFQENPSKEEDLLPFDVVEEKESVSVEIEGEIAEEGVEEEIEKEVEKEISDFDELLEETEKVDKEPTSFFSDEEIAKEDEDEKKGKRWTPGKVLAYILVVILVLGGVYLWLFPEIGEHVLNKVSYYMSADKLEEDDKSTNAKVGSVDFTDVKERFVKNWMFGDLLVIQGNVVNKYNYSISKIKVRGKILGAAGKVLDEVESYCGNLLTDEELGNLTEKEITEELSIPMGSDVSNDNIAPEGYIPFMIVFANPSKEAEEFIVELARDPHLSKSQ